MNYRDLILFAKENNLEKEVFENVVSIYEKHCKTTGLIGKEYQVYDYSYCVNLSTNEKANINTMGGMRFIITSQPYTKRIRNIIGELKPYKFINIRGENKNEYRVLFIRIGVQDEN